MNCAVERDLRAYMRELDREFLRECVEESIADELLKGPVWAGGVEFTVADVDEAVAATGAVDRIEAIESRGCSEHTRERLAAAYTRIWQREFDSLVSDLADLVEEEAADVAAEDRFDADL